MNPLPPRGAVDPGANGQGGRRPRGLFEFAFKSLTRASRVTDERLAARARDASPRLDLTDPAERAFGDYELVEWLGEGGTGAVYRARHLPLERDVAIKLLSAGAWASPEFVARFEREARNAARMQHPNIVTVFEVGTHADVHFFSMRLVEGCSLSALLRRGERFTPKAAASLVQTMAEAVAYAHSLGVLHLDLKPGNVLIDAAGVPHVADFGLARRLGPARVLDNEEVAGTPAYMAPEQTVVHEQPLTAATDVWGLGAILYEMVTGHAPFLGETAQATLDLVVRGQVRAPRRWKPRLPMDLQAIVLKCLRKSPEQRYRSARALADDLARFAEGRPVQARPLNALQRIARWTRREPKLAGFAFFAMGALLTGLIVAYGQSRTAAASAERADRTLWASRAEAAQRDIAQGDAYPALAKAVANLRDMAARGDRHDAALERLRIGTVLANAPQLIDVIPLGDRQIVSLAISPDASAVAAVTGTRTVHLIDVATGRQRWQVDVGVNSFGIGGMNRGLLELQFSADGRRLICHPVTEIGAQFAVVLYPHLIDSVMIDVASGTVAEPPGGFADFLATDYSDDGRYALLFDRYGSVQRWRTQPWTPDGERVRLDGLVGDMSVRGPLQGEALLTGDGRTMVLVSDANLRFHAFDARRMHRLRTLAVSTSQGRATTWALRHDNRELAIGTTSGQIVLWNLDSGNATWLPAHSSGWVAKLAYSADDTRLAVVSNEPNDFRVFDTRTRDLVAMPVSLDNEMNPGPRNDVQFGADAATVLTRHWASHATVWRLPQPGFPLQAPVAIAPPMVAEYARFAIATDARSRLLATADNGQLKLWRLRASPIAGLRAAPMVADTLHFDGLHLVAVDGNRANVVDAARGQVVGPTIVLPEAPTFAGLDGSGARLIAIAGRELSCWTWRDGKPCWAALSLPDSPLRLGFAAHAAVMAVSTGSNDGGDFHENVRLVDLARGALRGAPVRLRGPLGTLRLSADGRRLLAFEYRETLDAGSNIVHVIDTAHATAILGLVHAGKQEAHIIDARFADDGSIWSLAGTAGWDDGEGGYLRHWDADGRLLAGPLASAGDFGVLPLPNGRGVIETGAAVLVAANGSATSLAVAGARNRVNAGALSADGNLAALATLHGVLLHDLTRNQRLVPDLELALPSHDVVQQLAFAPDGSRLVGRTLGGDWFQWRIARDTRPLGDIARDLRLRNLSKQAPDEAGKTALAVSAVERRRLRDADPGPSHGGLNPAMAVTAPTPIAAPAAGKRYRVLDLEAIGNVDPRVRMNRSSRAPPLPQSLPTLPRGMQRFDGVDFLLGRAVQLSGAPQNFLNTEFPARSPALRFPAQRVAAVDVLVFQYVVIVGEAGSVRLHYADGGERKLAILDGRDTHSPFDAYREASAASRIRIGWLGNSAAAMRDSGLSSSGEAANMPADVVRLVNPEPARPVAAISFEAPSDASPGLLFLAATLEPLG